MTMWAYFRSAGHARGVCSRRYSDLVLVAGVVAIVALMVLPLPLWLIDLLVAANITSGPCCCCWRSTSALRWSSRSSERAADDQLFRLSLSIATRE